jgi:TonB-linked SusC/RagA family outer membrane protein
MLKKHLWTSSKLLKRSLLVFLLLAGNVAVYAQRQISGTVLDAEGNPVPYASVLIKGTQKGTMTDENGKYSIAVGNSENTLTFSFVGMSTVDRAIEGSTVNATLSDDAQALDDVVVIGYGAVRKRDLTGSVSSVGGKELANIPVSSAAEAITGKLAGVQITTAEGSPDAEVKIRVRGGGSITRDNSPLYIVDGFPVDNISDIPPSDIQSIDVLKDASSTAIYGARGANGVIIITTKSAREGKLTVNYNGYVGIKKITKQLDVLDPYEFVNLQYEQAALRDKVSSNYEEYFGIYDDMDMYKYMKGTNWQNEIFGNTGHSSNHSLSLNGGTKQASFNFSYNRIDEKAIMKGSDYTRDNLSFKLKANPLKRVKLDFTVRYSDTEINGSGANDVSGTEKSTSDSRLKHTVIYTPIPIKNQTTAEDDEESIGSLYPPNIAIQDNERNRRRKMYSYNGGVSIDIIKNLILRSEVGFDNRAESDKRFFGLSTYYVRDGATYRNQPAAQLTDITRSSFRNTNTLSWNLQDFIKGHSLSLMVGEEMYIDKRQTKENVVEAYPTYFLAEQAWAFTTQGNSISFNNYYAPDDKLLSFFGRANYSFGERYLASVTMRADGSSKFKAGNRWGYFPSAAIAWRISEESFMEGQKGWLSNLKIRFSYGTAGNNNITALSYMQTYRSYTTSWLPFATSYWAPGDALNNENLKWETTVTRNIGVDYGVFKSRINGAVEVYWNTTSDLLIDYQIPGSGYKTQLRNVGKTSNRGIEFTLNTAIVDRNDFKLDFSFNIGINKNKVESLGGMDMLQASSGWTSDAEASDDYRVFVGQPVGVMYGYVTDGYYSVDDFSWEGGQWKLKNQSQETPDNSGITGNSWGPGALKLKDLDGDGEITAADRQVIGNVAPKHTGGFSLTALYKGFDLALNFNWVYGNNIYNANKIEFTTTNKYNNRNMLTEMSSGNRWTNIDPATGALVRDPDALAVLNADADIWSPSMARYVFHSWAVEDGSFLRLNNVTLGYTLPQSATSKAFIQQLRFYVSIYNLLTITGYSGYDPEVDTRRKTPLTPGVDYSAYPKSRSFNFGVNLTF